MAMLAVFFVISFRLPASPERTTIQGQSLGFTIPALIPHGLTAVGHIDYGAHFGGVLLGIALGCFLLRTWHDDVALPRFRALAAVVAVAAGIDSQANPGRRFNQFGYRSGVDRWPGRVP